MSRNSEGSYAPVYILRTDGAARGNPGPAGIGVILEDSESLIVEKLGRGIGWATNNVAEYTALIEGLEIALAKRVERLKVFSDSTLLVEQMRGVFKVKSSGLKPLHHEARELVARFAEVEFIAVPREQNAEADMLANEGIDRWLLSHADFVPPEPPQSPLFE